MKARAPTFQWKNFLNLARALFPYWNFFDRVAYDFEIEFKIPNAVKWERIPFEARRAALDVFYSADANLKMAQVNIIEHFVGEIQDLQADDATLDSRDVQELTSFKLLFSLLSFRLKEYEIGASQVQFKIVACGNDEEIDVYISDWLEVETI